MVKKTLKSFVSIFIFMLLGLFVVPFCAAETPGNLIIEHGPRNSKLVALTFDACPTSHVDEYDEQVIEALLHANAPATLFMSGRWVEKNPEKAKFLADHPLFEIAAHSYYHPHLLKKDNNRVMREMQRTQAIIKKVTGKTPKYFRPPFGEVDERVATIAKAAGLTTIQYDIASGDPDPKLSPQRIVRVVVREAKGGSIIVFHMNRNGVHTAEILPEVIQKLRLKGFVLVTVGDMLKETNGDVKAETQSRGKNP
jgi:peptidoglycan-N-acetylglucosamine deacetylase